MTEGEINVIIGLPGSGKSTYALSLLQGIPNSIRINKDAVREMLHGPNNKFKDYNENESERESIKNILYRLQQQAIQDGLRHERPLIIDNLNLDGDSRRNIRQLAQQHADYYNVNVIINYHYINTPLETCIERNAKRAEPVNEQVIRELYNKFIRNHRTFPVEQPMKSTRHLFRCANNNTIHYPFFSY